MTNINPWINGNAEEAFSFYKSTFGGEFSKFIRFKDIASAEFPVPEAEADKIMYIALSHGTVHKVPADLRQAISSDTKAREAWESLTPLARNEWICWTISVKKEETRHEHVERVQRQLKQGKRRPCCWIGCIHRTDKAISPSVHAIIKKRK